MSERGKSTMARAPVTMFTTCSTPSDRSRHHISHHRSQRDKPLYRTRFFGHNTALGSLVGCDCCGHPVPPGLGRASVAVLFQQPVLIVAIEVGPDGGADLFDVLVDASEDDLLLQRTDESLGDAVGLGLANEGEAGYHAEELQLLLEVFGHEGTAVVVAQ